MKTIAIAGLLLVAGCMTTEIVIDPVKPWEGHYKTVEEFREKTAEMRLDKNESIWVISNNTLKRVLKKQTEKAQRQ